MSARLAAAVAGLALFGVFVLGVVFRLEQWNVPAFIALLHGSALFFAAAAELTRRAREAWFLPRQLPLLALGACLVGAYAWTLVPGVQHLCAAWVRASSLVLFR